ncbi:uncharacterized protein PAC_14249 [Phialocephala subalpina]|uniref:DUF6590 domain-containing protein n=1 Tax=Phialocephala subalpina TaxID=576137 RepID=A0A1L7XH47_9HELO|nr:uncharacterized protein PAC_14249 [Phialocephala subalpina]
MASKHDRNRRGKSDRAEEYQWSEWEWNAKKGKWYRWRYNSKNIVVWESQFSAATSEAVPRGEPSASTSTAITNFTSSATSSNQEYYGSAGYQYNDQAQKYNAVDDLAQELASTTLTEQDEAPAQAQYSYASDQEAQQTSGYTVAEEHQSAQPIDVVNPRSSSSFTTREQVSMFSSSGRMQGYTGTTGYDPSGPSSSYYNTQAAQYVDEDPGDDSPDLSRSYGSGVTVTQATHRASRRSRSDPPAPTPPAPLRIPSTLSISLSDVQKEIKGTKGRHEKLDPGFKVHASKFFQPGQIFKVVWAEPAGENSRSDATSMTDVTSEAWTVQQGEYGTKVYSSVRRFVVVATKTGHSNCVPILTYGRQGLNKPGLHAEDHAIIYTTDQPPINGDSHVNTPIQMQSKSPRDKLEPMSLVNYAKIYPVEHNVKVQFIGWIAKTSQLHFARDFDYVWNSHKQLR